MSGHYMWFLWDWSILRCQGSCPLSGLMLGLTVDLWSLGILPTCKKSCSSVSLPGEKSHSHLLRSALWADGDHV